jgi:formylglycine-generating enzyme required for sulfatase activity
MANSIALASLLTYTGCGKSSRQRLVVAPPKPGASWSNSLGMRFVPVTGTRALFSVYETRDTEFQLFLEETKTEWIPPDAERGPEYPVANVTWVDAVAFCEWLTQKERLAKILVTPMRYRLPTDAEWSLAAGLPAEYGSTPSEKSGSAPTIYPWGTAWPPPPSAGNFWAEDSKVDRNDPATFIAGYQDGYPRLAPVGKFTPDRHGLVARGGSWLNGDARSLALGHRAEITPRAGINVMGFRCVIVP